MKTAIALLLVLSAGGASAQQELPADTRSAIDRFANGVLAKTGAPSASIAVVKDDRIVYERAYGNARLDPSVPAAPAMRYGIGSISKEFTATAVLLLAEEGKLSLDDKVVRWLPELTRAGDVNIRELLSMTSGYQDFWPQDYVMPGMLEAATPERIVNEWARKPLDFEPGTKWQYSNTNYTIVGMIVEKASGMPLFDFLQKRIFTPLKMTSVYNSDEAALPPSDPMRYLRYAAGPPRPAPKEGRGWMFAAGELSMTAHDLALWDISMIDRTVLQPASYATLEHEVQLLNGSGTRYALGLTIASVDGRRLLTHGGEVSGFTAYNGVYPDDRVAVVVFTNLDATGAAEQIGTKIGQLVFSATDPANDTALATVRSIFDDLQHGKIDRALFTANANAYFSDQAIHDFATSLGPLGHPQSITQSAQSLRGGMVLRRYAVKFGEKSFRITTFWMPDGKLEQYIVAATD